jgi:hypothetical protein
MTAVKCSNCSAEVDLGPTGQDLSDTRYKLSCPVLQIHLAERAATPTLNARTWGRRKESLSLGIGEEDSAHISPLPVASQTSGIGDRKHRDDHAFAHDGLDWLSVDDCPLHSEFENVANRHWSSRSCGHHFCGSLNMQGSQAMSVNFWVPFLGPALVPCEAYSLFAHRGWPGAPLAGGVPLPPRHPASGTGVSFETVTPTPVQHVEPPARERPKLQCFPSL